MSEEFDPKQFRVATPRGFADLKVGETFRSPSRTVTDAHFSAFQALSGDNHPIHYDAEYCRARGYPGVLAHGLQVLCFTAAGAGYLRACYRRRADRVYRTIGEIPQARLPGRHALSSAHDRRA